MAVPYHRNQQGDRRAGTPQALRKLPATNAPSTRAAQNLMAVTNITCPARRVAVIGIVDRIQYAFGTPDLTASKGGATMIPDDQLAPGGVPEWLNGPVLKTGVALVVTVGSNPTPTAWF